MRSKGFLSRWYLVMLLGLLAAAPGCEDENAPKTWVGKLGEDRKRPGAMRHLRQLWETRVTAAHDNLQDREVQAFLNEALPAIVDAFRAHPQEVSTRKEAIPILAGCHDPRAVPALLSALEFSPGNSDSERIALQAAQALEVLRPTSPDALQKLLAGIDRAVGSQGSAPQIREAILLTLGAIGDRSVVPRLRDILKRPLDQQDFRTARGACQALGRLGDPAAVDALVYALYVRVRSNGVFPYAARALVHLGATVAVPAIINAMEGHNGEVMLLLQSYATAPGAEVPPPGTLQGVALDALRGFADRRAIAPLITLAQNRTVLTDAPSARLLRARAAEALAYSALPLPPNDPERARAYDVVAQLFNEEPVAQGDMAGLTADSLAMFGDPRAAGVIAARLNDRQLQNPGAEPIAYRIGLMSPLARAVRHGDIATYDRVSTVTRSLLERLSHDPEAQDPDSQNQLRQIRTGLQEVDAVAAVARDCTDGDLACYRGKLSATNRDILRKVFRMMAWTLVDNAEARGLLLARGNSTDPPIRQAIHLAVDAMSPHGCAECITRLEAIVQEEHNQESKSLLHLDAEFLIARLRARAQ
jgi:HEAT repeat protein